MTDLYVPADADQGWMPFPDRPGGGFIRKAAPSEILSAALELEGVEVVDVRSNALGKPVMAMAAPPHAFAADNLKTGRYAVIPISEETGDAE